MQQLMTSAFPRPMLATLGRPPERFADYAVEAKYDGQRGVAVVDRGGVTLLSRNGADITRTFPEITAALPEAIAAVA
jgi:bifunctional non-homologous end joining protein LigD